jgi:hypothetical protein
MFANPAGAGDLARDMNFLQTIEFDALVEEWQNPSCPDIVQAGIHILLERINKFCILIRSKEVIVDVRYGRVSPDNAELCQEIKRMNPFAISWSNVPDYFHPKDFFSMAASCSADRDTVHYFYSMNWIATCYGASVFDIKSVDKRFEIQRKSLECIDECYRLKNVHPLLLSPPVVNVINTASYVTSQCQFSNWVDTFFRYSKVEKKSRREICHSFNPFARVLANVYVKFSFDPLVKFQD